MAASGAAFETHGVRVAVEGCGHGTLDAIYASVATASKARGWDGVDLLIIGGDFEAVRNAADLSVMSVPAKYRELGDFPAYYSGEKTAPYLTIFIAGNHEASSYLWELYYGGWVAPNIYYLGAANVLRFGPLRIAGMSGIWKGFDYRKPHHERLPFNQDSIKSFYHVREIDIRKLLLLREQVDVGLSHDWPRAIENHGDSAALWRMKPDFRQESIDGSLGNPAAEYVMDRLRPAYWFSAHMHCKFAAIKTYPPPSTEGAQAETSAKQALVVTVEPEQPTGNPDEIDLDEEDEAPAGNSNEAEVPPPSSVSQPAPSSVTDELRAQLPASFATPAPRGPKLNPGQPVPCTITNTTTRFLALDKCLPGRKFIQLCALEPVDPSHLKLYPPSSPTSTTPRQRYTLSYDPEWLAITRVFSQYLTIGEPSAVVPQDLGEEVYTPLIDAERAWVEEHVVGAGKLVVPENFEITAPPHVKGSPESVDHQPEEYTNPQTTAFCELVGVKNLWDASPEERAERKAKGPPPSSGGDRRGGFRGRGGRGGVGGFGRGRGFMRGRGRGGGRGGWH
ncbi:lariat debranching enzyme, C-terminal domain-containing protein [Xylariaceae sp. FL1651]|nr:lariat debranching enzyme, C-terminal domain-containing protein [Xylariaceae sp. FL1651]